MKSILHFALAYLMASLWESDGKNVKSVWAYTVKNNY